MIKPKKLFLAGLIALAVIVVGYNSCLALESDQREIFNQSIPYFNIKNNGGSGCTSSGSASIAALTSGAKDARDAIFKALTGTSFTNNNNKPLNVVQAAAVLGNVQAESGFNPKADNKQGYRGIVQWSSGRYANISDPKDDLNNQIAHLIKELDTVYAAPLSKSGFWSASSPDNIEQATFAITRNYEVAIMNGGGPTTWTSNDSAKRYLQAWERRRDFAKNILNDYNTGGGTGSGGGSAGSTSSSGCFGAMPATSFVEGNIGNYYQFDERWKDVPYGSSTIRKGGCGPTSMASILTAMLGQNISPIETATYAGQHGGWVKGSGSSWSVPEILSQKWPIRVEPVAMSVDAINKALDNKAMIWLCGNGTVPFSDKGHCIGIAGRNASGQWVILDSSGRSDKVKGLYNPQSVLTSGAHAGSIKAIYKR